MDEQDVEVFINDLTLKLNLYCFDYLAPIPMPFSDLAKVNRVSDEEAVRSLGLPDGYGKPLKDFLKPIKAKDSGKRKLKSSSSHGSATKSMKADLKRTINVTDTVDTIDEPLTSAIEDNPAEMDKEEEQMAVYIDFEDNKIKKALKLLNSFLEEENLNKLKKVLQQSRDEGELEVGLGIHLFSKLMGKAYTSREKSLRSCPCGCQEKLLDHENMWIGSESTWYGELDIVAGNPTTGDAVSVFVKNSSGSVNTEIQKDDEVNFEEEETKDEENEEENPDSSDSPGDRTNVEALNQVIAQAVVFAFTEYNRHTSKGKIIPSVLIDKTCFQYVLYSPVDDILLVSNYMSYTNMANFEKKSGFRPFVVLWIILNHRLFFTKCPDFRRHFIKSGFHENISDLQEFQNLRDYSKIICRKQKFSKHFPDDTPNTIGTTAMDWFLDT